MRKGAGKEAKLSYGMHALMENRHGLCVQVAVTASTEKKTTAAKELIGRQIDETEKPPASVGADKGYHNQEFVGFCREQEIKPNVAPITGPEGPRPRRTHHTELGLSNQPADSQTSGRDFRLD